MTRIFLRHERYEVAHFGKLRALNILADWIIVNKVDRKSDGGEKNIFKNIGRKKIDGGMRSFAVIKTLNILKKRKL